MFSRTARRRLASAFLIAALCATALAAAGRWFTARAEGTFDLRDFGAVGDGTTDDAPALQAALDALAASGGGTLNVPAGKYVIASPVLKDFTGLADDVVIQGVASATVVDTEGTPTELATGLGLASEFYPRTHEQNRALYLKGLRSLLVKDIAFVGTDGISNDASITLGVENVGQAVVRHCEFYGLSTLFGGAIVYAERSGLHIEQTKFLGSVGNSGVYVPVVQNLEWKSVSLADVVFLDYGLRPELFGKTGFGAPHSWVGVGNAAPVTADSPRREVSIRRVFLDEGGYVGLASLPFRYPTPPTAPIDLYYITGLRMNVSNLGTTGHYLDGINDVLVENSRYGWSHNTDSAIYVLRSGQVILDRIHTEAAATRLRADPSVGSLTVINSVYEDLASAAGTTRVINTATDEEDPVWFVRERFDEVLGREPDPAAHFYWSRRLLACPSGNAACVAAERAALENYLAQNPAPKFAIEGTAADEDGVALPGVTVALTGSQTVSTVTDAEGHYRFSNLPTSGAYTVTASKPFYTFAPRAFALPAGDQNGDLNGVVSRFAVGGRLALGDNTSVAGATVRLEGPAGTETTTTDSGGNYAFTGLKALRNYKVTPSKLGVVFAPASQTFDNLSANGSANFNGTPTFYTLTGRVTTTAGGAGVGGATVTLSGSLVASATTNPDGTYSFANLPHGGDFNVAPAPRAGVIFSPASRTLTNLVANATADFTDTPLVNHARSSNGATALASSTLDNARRASAAINGDRLGAGWGTNPATGSGWHDATANAFPDWLEVQFAGARTVAEVDVFSVQDAYTAPVVPTASMTFTKYGLTNFRVEYWDGAAWLLVPNGLVVSNNKVWSKVVFEPLTTTKMRVLVNDGLGGHSRVTELEAWGAPSTAPSPTPTPTPTPTPSPTPAPTPVNHALAANGATALASSTLDNARRASAAINGDRLGAGWGTNPATGSGWHDATANAFPDWLEVQFAGARTINSVVVVSVQDAYTNPQTPTDQMTFTRYGLADFEVQYWDGAAWAAVPGGVVVGNNKVVRRVDFAPLVTERVRVLINFALGGYSRATELEAWGDPVAAPPSSLGKTSAAALLSGRWPLTADLEIHGFGFSGFIGPRRDGRTDAPASDGAPPTPRETAELSTLRRDEFTCARPLRRSASP